MTREPIVHPPLNITMVAPSLGMGGTERVVQLLSAGFSRSGHSVTVITTTSRADFFELDASVARVRLDLTGSEPGRASSAKAALGTFVRVPRGLRRLRRGILDSDPDVVISFMEHANVLTAALIAHRVPLLLTEHIDPSRHELGLGWRVLRRLLYRRAAFLVSVSNGVDEKFSWMPSTKRLVIHNPIATEVSEVTVDSSDQRAPYIAAMGRLCPQKGFDLLLDAFVPVADSHETLQLLILGAGRDLEALREQTLALGLQERVSFLGAIQNPFPLLSGAELFVMSSRWEGFPLSLFEALSCGVPVVSFDCPSGPSEIVQHDINGLLVPPEDTAALSEAIDLLLVNEQKRSAFAQAARTSVERFSINEIVAEWERELYALLAGETESVPAEVVGR